MFRKFIMAVLAASVVATPVVVATPQKAEAAAINVSNTRETQIRLAVNRYAAAQVVKRAPYCRGGTGPCFDCSGLVVAAYRSAGISIPVRTSTDMRRWTTATSLRYARTGDLLFYSGHVEIFYKSNGTGRPLAIAANTPGRPVNIHEIRRTGLLKVGQVVT